jgi:hypothetical protein
VALGRIPPVRSRCTRESASKYQPKR